MDTHPMRQPLNESERNVKIFISYAHEDQDLHEKLVMHLHPLIHLGNITLWQDQEIPAGANWEEQITTHLNEADVILLLVSARFIASKYCWNKEVQTALERHQAGEVRVIPIILRPVIWRSTPLGQLQALPSEGKPVTQWNDQDAAFADVAWGIQRTIEGLSGEHPSLRKRLKDIIHSTFLRVKNSVPGKNLNNGPLSRAFLLMSALLLLGPVLSLSLNFFSLPLPPWASEIAPLLVLPFVLLLLREARQPPGESRERRAFLWLSAVTIAFFALESFGRSVGRLTQLRIGFLPGAGDKNTNPTNNDSFENDVKDMLGVEVSVQFLPSYTDTVQALAQGSIEMAWLGPFSYLYAVEKCHPRLLLCLRTEEASNSYYSYIIVKATSGIRSLHELKGKMFAIVDTLSTSGYLVPKYIFKKANIDLDQELTVKIGSSHPNVLQAVLNGTTFAGAISSQIYDDALTKGSFKKDDLQILNTDYKNYPIPSGPIVLRKDIHVDDALRIEDAFFVVAENDPIALNTLNAKGFAKITDHSYQIIRDIVQELHIDISKTP